MPAPTCAHSLRRSLFVLLLLPLSARADTVLRLQVDDLISPQLTLKKIEARVTLGERTSLSLAIGEARIAEHAWHHARLDCPRAVLRADAILCEQGVLDMGRGYPISFHYSPATRQLAVRIDPEHGERWSANVRWGDAWRVETQVAHGALIRLNDWAPDVALKPGAGRIDLTAQALGDARGIHAWEAQATLRDVAFGDSSGARAGEHVSGSLHARGDDRRWQIEARQAGGELFWQPFYLPAASRQLSASGVFDANAITLQAGSAQFGDIGAVRFAGQWDRARQHFAALDIQGAQLAFESLYRTVLKPLLGESAWARFETGGQLEGKLALRDGELSALQLTLHDASLRHEAGTLVLDGVQADIPWRRDGASQATLRAASGSVRGLAIGAFRADAVVEPGRVRVQPLQVPVLDGALVVDELQFERARAGWGWRFAGALRPISMPRLSAALQWPALQGTLSGVIPRVSYAEGVLNVDGALLARIFDGTVVVKHVSATDPLSVASRVRADVDLANLDLALLTRQFFFGSITGRLDGAVTGLELSGWQPVAFDARFASSPGSYPREISQRAVESISALGGGSATAAIQRSFLRFFDQFGYDRIGWQCRLARDVCEMGGIEDLPQGYLMVKGGGIPALSVIGYNRRVNWSDLLERLRRATQRGVRPVVQ